jgi:hypothetical protein
MPTPRHSREVAVANGKLYALAGWNQASGYLNVVEEYDPALNQWRSRGVLPVRRSGFGIGTIGGRIFIFGGLNAGGYIKTIDECIPSIYSNYVTSPPLAIDQSRRSVAFITLVHDLRDSVYENQLYLDTVRAYTPVPESSCHYSFLSGAPESLQIDSTAGVITWTPRQRDVGSHVIRVLAQDRRGSTDTLTFTLKVIDVNAPPKIDSICVEKDTLFEGDSTRLQAFASDEENDSLRYLWMKNKRDTLGRAGSIQFVPGYREAGKDTIILIINDGRGGTARDTVRLVIWNRPLPPSILNRAGDNIDNQSRLQWAWVSTPRDPNLDSNSIRYMVRAYRDAGLLDLVGAADSLTSMSVCPDSLDGLDTLPPRYIWVKVEAHDRKGYSTGWSRAVQLFFANSRYLDRHFPAVFYLGWCYPNPFTIKTKLDFSVPPSQSPTVDNFSALLNEKRNLKIYIYSIDGRLSRALADGPTAVGFHTIVFDGKSDNGQYLEPGLYVCKMTAEGYSAVRWFVKGN